MGKEVVDNGHVPDAAADKGKKAEEAKAPTPPAAPLDLLQACLSILEKAVNMKDVRLITGRYAAANTHPGCAAGHMKATSAPAHVHIATGCCVRLLECASV